MSNVYHLRRLRLPSETSPLLAKLQAASARGACTGVAVIAFLDGHGYIAETTGEANEDLAQTRLLLKAFDAKLAKRQLAARSGEGE
jgi:hypothetical protein